MKKDSSYKHILKYTSLFGGVQVLNVLMGLVRNKAVALLLGPQGVGLISIFNSASTLIQNSTNFGLQMSGVREISEAFARGDEEATRQHIALLRSWSLLAALLGLLVCIMASWLLSQWAFSNDDYTLDFIMLSVVVALAAISGGEVAILKATRRLKPLAKTSVVGVFLTLITSVPIFYFWRNEGILPSLILTAVMNMLLTIAYSWRYYPPRLVHSRRGLEKGIAMIKLGTAFILAGIIGSGAEFLVRSYLSDISISLTGLYNAGYMITMTYAGMVFAAMETDYFPHLSAVCSDTRKTNGAVNRQIEVSLIMVAPLLIALIFGIQILIPLLFSQKFIPVIGMTQIAVLAMFFRAVNLPVSYITLAKGDSKSYLLLESISDVLLVCCVIFGYQNWGLEGTGIALAVVAFLNCINEIAYCSWKYDLEISNRSILLLATQFLLALASVIAVTWFTDWLYWFAGAAVFLISTFTSYKSYKQTQK